MDRKYVRVYYDDLIRDYPDVWSDDAQLATWLRLLATADPMWPTPPELPRTAKARTLTKLAATTLVDLLGGHRFRVKGLDAERERRAASGRIGAAVRWHSDGNPTPDPTAMPRRGRDETRRTEDENDARATDDDGREDLETFLLLKRRAPTPKQRRLLDEVMARHDLTGPAWAANIMLQKPDDPIGAVIEADQQWRAMRIAEAQAAERPTPKPRRKGSGLTGINAELASYFADLEQKRKHDSDAA